MSNLDDLTNAGVAIWLDDLSRDRLQSGNLQELINTSRIVGVTTNPSIFSAAISGSTLYKKEILELKRAGHSISDILTELTTSDVRTACDLFLTTFVESDQIDGRVSIEVEPNLAYDTSATVERAISLSRMVNRPNLFIKVPATMEGIPAIEELTARGISVNVTLIFSVTRYKLVIDAYLRGLERRVSKSESLLSIHSVASFFISRIDTEIDKQLDSLSPDSPLRGKAAIANAHLAYEAFQNIVRSQRWQKLVKLGANVQRPLWASTGVKDKSYESTRYVIELVAPDCVNTMPEATLDEVRARGIVRGDTITSRYEEARTSLAGLAVVGIDLNRIVRELENDGVSKFEKAWEQLAENIAAVTQ